MRVHVESLRRVALVDLHLKDGVADPSSPWMRGVERAARGSDGARSAVLTMGFGIAGSVIQQNLQGCCRYSWVPYRES